MFYSMYMIHTFVESSHASNFSFMIVTSFRENYITFRNFSSTFLLYTHQFPKLRNRKKKKKKKKHEEGKSKNLKKIQQNSTYIEATIATSNSPKGVSYFLRGSAGNLKKFPTTTLRDFIYTTLSRLPL